MDAKKKINGRKKWIKRKKKRNGESSIAKTLGNFRFY